MYASNIIALLTDFDISDNYIGVMKGVILSINPDARIVDLAHGLRKFDIRYAAFLLLTAYKYFPRGTIFVGVVDPGVGTEREAIILKTRNYYFVGPNNGLFSLVAKKDGLEEIRELRNRKYALQDVSYTFHGRDLFSPAAAYLSLGTPLEEFGPYLPESKFVEISISEPEICGEEYQGEVLAIDSFGNVITNIPGDIFTSREKIGAAFLLRIGNNVYVLKFRRAYGEADEREGLILVGSHNFVEFAVNRGSARDRFCLKVGEKFKLIKIKQNSNRITL